MTEKVKKRRDMIINVAFVAMIFGLIFFFVKYLFGVTAPFLLSFCSLPAKTIKKA